MARRQQRLFFGRNQRSFLTVGKTTQGNPKKEEVKYNESFSLMNPLEKKITKHERNPGKPAQRFVLKVT